MSSFVDRLLGRKDRNRVELTPEKPPAGSYHAVWERKRLPGPGAMNYAYESLGLVPMTPIGPGIRTRQPIIPFAQQQVQAENMAAIVGMPTVAGQLVHQPLYDPQSPGYGRPITETMFNIPFAHSDIAPAGAGTLS